MVIVAILTVRPDRLEAFREYETRAALIMRRYGGAIERTIVVEPTVEDSRFREVHVLRFPSVEEFGAYRADAELKALAAVRAECVVETEILMGVDGPDYGGRPPVPVA